MEKHWLFISYNDQLMKEKYEICKKEIIFTTEKKKYKVEIKAKWLKKNKNRKMGGKKTQEEIVDIDLKIDIDTERKFLKTRK